MFHKTSITSKIKESKFIEITANCIGKFKELFPEDKTNLTPDNRHLREYNRRLKCSLKNIILDLAKLTGRKIDILDSGCGKCVAIEELLSDPELKDSLGTCTGISMNYFTDVEIVMEKHGDRFKYFYGKVQDVLEQTHKQFDIIIDMAGAHLYSVDKVNLMKLYHQALRPGGRAEVFHQNIKIQVEGDTASFYPAISSKYPKTFFDKTNQALTISKSLRHFPLPELKVTSYSERQSFKSTSKKISLKRAREGNGVCPQRVEYEVSASNKRRRIS